MLRKAFVAPSVALKAWPEGFFVGRLALRGKKSVLSVPSQFSTSVGLALNVLRVAPVTGGTRR